MLVTYPSSRHYAVRLSVPDARYVMPAWTLTVDTLRLNWLKVAYDGHEFGFCYRCLGGIFVDVIIIRK